MYAETLYFCGAAQWSCPLFLERIYREKIHERVEDIRKRNSFGLMESNVNKMPQDVF